MYICFSIQAFTRKDYVCHYRVFSFGTGNAPTTALPFTAEMWLYRAIRYRNKVTEMLCVV